MIYTCFYLIEPIFNIRDLITLESFKLELYFKWKYDIFNTVGRVSFILDTKIYSIL